MPKLVALDIEREIVIHVCAVADALFLSLSPFLFLVSLCFCVAMLCLALAFVSLCIFELMSKRPLLHAIVSAMRCDAMRRCGVGVGVGRRLGAMRRARRRRKKKKRRRRIGLPAAREK